ncbi:MAG: glycosyltransferase family 2 protein [Anaerolineae bacterium]|nr:glycosyltransferase family 2 protein [Anaerolineae bacterium]
MTERPLDLSIIIISFNVRDLLRDCLQSVFEHHDALTIEVFVVDNASGDDSAAMVRTEFPQVTLIENDDNRGFAAANNQAIEIARGRQVLLLNSDTVVLPGALTTLVALIDSDERIAVVGPKLLNPDGSLQTSCRSFPNPINFSIYSFASYNVLPRLSWPVPFLLESWDHSRRLDLMTGHVLGAAMLIRRAVFEQIGTLDEDYFFYGEEKDFCYRAIRAGYRVVFEPAAQIIHYGGQSSQQIPQKTMNALYESLDRFTFKHYARWYALLISVILHLGLLFKFGTSTLINLIDRLRSRQRRYNPNIFWHTFLNWRSRYDKRARS